VLTKQPDVTKQTARAEGECWQALGVGPQRKVRNADKIRS
jgi:hypothetical protein